jgi:hypothetical protein
VQHGKIAVDDQNVNPRHAGCSFLGSPAPPCCLNPGSPKDSEDPVYLGELFKEVLDKNREEIQTLLRMPEMQTITVSASMMIVILSGV